MVANNDRALATRPVAPQEWGIMLQQGEMLVKTGFLPEAIKTKEQAVAIMLKGRELNVPAMYALSNISVIKGKPVAGAELLLAIIYRDHGDGAIKFNRSDEQACIVEYRRRSWGAAKTFNFTMEDAKRAGLANKDVWKQYPAAMLRARCISAVARMAFPDSIGGMYTPEEMGAEVTITDQDEIRLELPEPPASAPVATVIDHETGEVLDGDDLVAQLMDAAQQFGEDLQETPEDAPQETPEERQAIDWAAALEGAGTIKELNNVVTEFKRAGITHGFEYAKLMTIYNQAGGILSAKARAGK